MRGERRKETVCSWYSRELSCETVQQDEGLLPHSLVADGLTECMICVLWAWRIGMTCMGAVVVEKAARSASSCALPGSGE